MQRLDEKLVLLHRAPNLATAELLRGVLVNEGIRVFLRAPRLSPFIGVDETDILVPSSEEKAAREVLEAFLEPDGDPGGREAPEGDSGSPGTGPEGGRGDREEGGGRP